MNIELIASKIASDGYPSKQEVDSAFVIWNYI